MNVYNHKLDQTFSYIDSHFNDLLQSWTVLESGIWENEDGPKVWWPVSNHEESIVAYFCREEDAFRFRLAEINRSLNG